MSRHDFDGNTHRVVDVFAANVGISASDCLADRNIDLNVTLMEELDELAQNNGLARWQAAVRHSR